MMGHFPAVLSFNRLCLKLDQFICNTLPVLPDHSTGLRVYPTSDVFPRATSDKGSARDHKSGLLDLSADCQYIWVS